MTDRINKRRALAWGMVALALVFLSATSHTHFEPDTTGHSGGDLRCAICALSQGHALPVTAVLNYPTPVALGQVEPPCAPVARRFERRRSAPRAPPALA